MTRRVLLAGRRQALSSSALPVPSRRSSRWRRPWSSGPPIVARQPIQSVIDEDLGLLYTQSKEGIALGGKVLVVRRDPGITDLHSSHKEHGCSNPPVTVHFIVRVLRTWPRPATARNMSVGFRGTVIDRLTDELAGKPASGEFVYAHEHAEANASACSE